MLVRVPKREIPPLRGQRHQIEMPDRCPVGCKGRLHPVPAAHLHRVHMLKAVPSPLQAQLHAAGHSAQAGHAFDVEKFLGALVQAGERP